LLDLLVEAAEGAFERLVLTHSDFCQSRFTSSGSVSLRRSRSPPPRGDGRPPWSARSVPPAMWTAPEHGSARLRTGSQGRRSIAAPPRGVNRTGNVSDRGRLAVRSCGMRSVRTFG
jgi:hypothetical protein